MLGVYSYLFSLQDGSYIKCSLCWMLLETGDGCDRRRRKFMCVFSLFSLQLNQIRVSERRYESHLSSFYTSRHMSPIHSETQTLRKIECPASAKERIKESVPHLRPREGNEGQTDEREPCFVAVRDWDKNKGEKLKKSDDSVPRVNSLWEINEAQKCSFIKLRHL